MGEGVGAHSYLESCLMGLSPGYREYLLLVPPFLPRCLRKLRLLSGDLPTHPWPSPPPSQHPPEDGAPILTEYQSGIEGKEHHRKGGGEK